MFLIHKLYILFCIFFESDICWTNIDLVHSFQTVVQMWANYLTTGLNFPPFFCWSFPQGVTKLCNGEYFLHSLVLDFFSLVFFQVLLPQKTCLVSQCFITFSNLKIPKSPSSWPTFTKLYLNSNYPKLPALGYYYSISWNAWCLSSCTI